MKLTDAQLDEAERLDREATPGPWRECGADRGSCQCAQVWSEAIDALLVLPPHSDDVDVIVPLAARKANAALIAWLRNHCAALVAEVREARATKHEMLGRAGSYGRDVASLSWERDQAMADRDAAREALATETRNANAYARERDEAKGEVDDAIRRLKCERGQYTKGGSLADEVTAVIERFSSDERYIESLLHVYTAADDDGAEIIRLHAEVQRVTRERDATRAEIDRLESALEDFKANAPHPSVLDDLSAARAEVERLRVMLIKQYDEASVEIRALQDKVAELKKQFELHRISVAASAASDAEEVRAEYAAGPLDALQITSRDRDEWKRRAVDATAEVAELKRLIAGREAQLEEFIAIARAARAYVDAIEHGFASTVRPDVARRDLDAELRKAGY